MTDPFNIFDTLIEAGVIDIMSVQELSDGIIGGIFNGAVDPDDIKIDILPENVPSAFPGIPPGPPMTDKELKESGDCEMTPIYNSAVAYPSCFPIEFDTATGFLFMTDHTIYNGHAYYIEE